MKRLAKETILSMNELTKDLDLKWERQKKSLMKISEEPKICPIF